MPNQRTHAVSFLLLLASLSYVSGCAHARSSNATCPVPNGAKCLSLTDVYDRTNTADEIRDEPEQKSAKNGAGQAVQQATPATIPTAAAGPKGPLAYRPVKHADTTTAGDTLSVVRQVPLLQQQASVAAHKPLSPDPIRAAGKVMRIYISEWEDETGSLHMPGTIFTEIEPRRWSVGLPAMTEAEDFRLLEGLGSKAANESQASASSANAAATLPGK